MLELFAILNVLCNALLSELRTFSYRSRGILLSQTIPAIPHFNSVIPPFLRNLIRARKSKGVMSFPR